MASAEQLINDAQFAFANVTPGSADEKKFRRQAQRYAMRIVSRYPTSTEATQARQILWQLGMLAAEPTRRENLVHNHLSDAEQSKITITTHSAEAHNIRSKRSAGTASLPNDYSWGMIWKKFAGISHEKKKVLLFGLFFISLIVAAFPFLALAIFIYLARPRLLQEHLYKSLDLFA